jgi:SAM-dependent methyltransferase
LPAERSYVLGTHDEEIARLGLQHRLWRPRALEAWQRANFTAGQTILDVGCGPGYAALDLAEIVGPSGRVLAVDRSRRYLDVLEAARRERGLDQIETHEQDLDDGVLPRAGANGADGVWCRWVFAFVKRPRDLLVRIANALGPRGTLALHEYFDYSTWRLAPRSTEFEAFVKTVMETWRESGGEPDIGLELPRWLRELGFEIRSMRSIIDIVLPADELWQWPKAFVEVGLRRLVDLGKITPERASAVLGAFEAAEVNPHALLVTPAVIEIVAARGERPAT